MRAALLDSLEFVVIFVFLARQRPKVLLTPQGLDRVSRVWPHPFFASSSRSLLGALLLGTEKVASRHRLCSCPGTPRKERVGVPRVCFPGGGRSLSSSPFNLLSPIYFPACIVHHFAGFVIFGGVPRLDPCGVLRFLAPSSARESGQPFDAARDCRVFSVSPLGPYPRSLFCRLTRLLAPTSLIEGRTGHCFFEPRTSWFLASRWHSCLTACLFSAKKKRSSVAFLYASLHRVRCIASSRFRRSDSWQHVS